MVDVSKADERFATGMPVAFLKKFRKRNGCERRKQKHESSRDGTADMETVVILDELQRKALSDAQVREQLLATRTAADPLKEFCRVSRELGYELYEMDLIAAGEEFYASMRRSTNGGGENSPMLEGEDDFYELFFASIEGKNAEKY